MTYNYPYCVCTMEEIFTEIYHEYNVIGICQLDDSHDDNKMYQHPNGDWFVVDEDGIVIDSGRN
jgi:hypothetical protein